MDCCASNLAKLARTPGSLIWMIGPQAGDAAEPAGPETAAMARAANAARAMARVAVMAVPFPANRERSGMVNDWSPQAALRFKPQTK
jgi:hypothetical protein